MSRSSRFSKLEGEREGGADKPASGASLERFAAEPELSGRAEPVDAMAPVQGAERLQRFEEDGAEGLGLDRDPLAELPMLECPACGIACGKFETGCHGCHASLTTPFAREHNLKRLEALKLERFTVLEAERGKRDLEMLDAEQRVLQARVSHGEMAPGMAEANTPIRKVGLVRLGIGLLSLLFAFFGHGGLQVFAVGILAVVVMTLIPQRVWIRLGKNARFRDRD